ncbi:sulfatase-like hydrolase/transferase [Actinomadura madurae]|uniref:sulfatase-like hydrolase/transferase n=1 Tax=Actinomadura madurae TaxID=1993 RepID=UPI0024E25B2E|nr:sulfatase-like hydrolase/transferase [Actinomadura madurae]
MVIVLFDDLGYGQFGCFGSDISTPNVDALAGGGARYNRFHVTGLCSPTRASLLTGRNHHRVGMGQLTESPQTSPGYSAHIPTSAGTLAQVLRNNGYNTMAVGKWHLTPGGNAVPAARSIVGRSEWDSSGSTGSSGPRPITGPRTSSATTVP